MTKNRPIHPHFSLFLDHKQSGLIKLYSDLRQFILDACPECNELLYHTHALTSIYTLSEKMGDGFCMIPIYTNHLNLGFHKGTLLADPHQLLKGTGKFIRHIAVTQISDYRNKKVEALVKSAIHFASEDMSKPSQTTGQTISKIKI